MTHTPGPWVVAGPHPSITICKVFRSDQWQPIAELWYYANGEAPDEVKANARLIATAPEMLHELENCGQDFRNLAAYFQPGSDSRQIAENCAARVAALARKARGE